MFRGSLISFYNRKFYKYCIGKYGVPATLYGIAIIWIINLDPSPRCMVWFPNSAIDKIGYQLFLYMSHNSTSLHSFPYYLQISQYKLYIVVKTIIISFSLCSIKRKLVSHCI